MWVIEESVMNIFSILGGIIMTVAAFLGLASEIPDAAPLWQQLVLWVVALAVFLVGYAIHRLGGGSFRFRDLLENE